MRYLLATVMLGLATLAASGTVQAAPAYQFTMGFAQMAAQIPDAIGEPVESEHYGPNGDSLQRTTTGLLVWRKADNWTAFTNGSRTWVSGPTGVQERSNEDRFPWESNTPAAPLIPAPAPAPAAPEETTTLLAFSIIEDFETSAEAAALSLINESRQQYGLPKLVMDEKLRQMAKAYSRDMSLRDFFAHVNPDGLGLGDRLDAANVRFSYAAENLGWSRGYASSIEGVRANHKAMMDETPPNDGHRVNILNGSLRKVGIGVYKGTDDKVYYTAEFTD